MKFLKILTKSVVYIYKLLISPYIIPSCKFIPSCSTYAIDAINKLPLKIAIIKILARILKCNPFNKNDKLDIA
jgi:putative membrane protein insertion efficiency factor